MILTSLTWRYAGTFNKESNESENYKSPGGLIIISNTDFKDGELYDKLALGWENGGMYYALIAVLGENLEEPTLEQIACSVRTY